ncbi:MAG: serine hydrolase domain-containing protein [Parachlamydiales bacterium]|jgi:CubicO group peptidase (beta-lactamase class C family)
MSQLLRTIFVFGCLSLVNLLSLYALPPLLLSPNVKNISPILQSLIEEYKIPGMAAAVVSSDKLIAAGVAGVRSRNYPNKVTIEDQFHLGSDTKSMTATVIARLVERGLINWNTKVVDLFPALQGNIDPRYNNLDLQQLLTHRGGIVPNLPFRQIQTEAGNNLVKARQMGMKQALNKAPVGNPGEYHYSNMGYVIAGHMAEKVTGEPWEQIMRTQLFFPLGMQSAGFQAPGNGLFTQPVGHTAEGKPVGLSDNPEMMGPAGTVHVSILDWAKYAMLHLRAARGNPSLITQALFDKLQQPVSNPPPAYAMGWGVSHPRWAQGKVLTHAGSNTYWFAIAWIAPKKDVAILVACNQGGEDAKAACNKAALRIRQSLGIQSPSALVGILENSNKN